MFALFERGSVVQEIAVYVLSLALVQYSGLERAGESLAV